MMRCQVGNTKSRRYKVKKQKWNKLKEKKNNFTKMDYSKYDLDF